MEYITQGIILNAHELKESDKIYNIFSFDRGLIKAYAKSVSSPLSKLSGFLMPGNSCIFMLASGKTIDKMAQVRVIKSHKLINDYNVFILWNQIVEVLLGFLNENNREVEVYNSTICFIEDLNDENLSIEQKRLLQISYFSDLVREFGFSPNWFNLSPILNQVLQDMLKNNYLKNRDLMIKLDMKDVDLGILKTWFKHYLESVLEKKLKSF